MPKSCYIPNPPTACAIFAVVEIGQEINPEHYEAVAAAIRFAEALREVSTRKW
ncbi:EscU/YscU/HrcU family type III secretion system export apparatus switch protein [Planktotalea sp.]|uniref:EscU/YscU/HrcU family type III secretion system export apparatus switch protein n=1 Tax=Planktotalea sp. TaxID=2029877 RepID=UPI0025D7579F|nr:EscU/YscU/HrcU family type III secretion system export apparatus switch protein [Planktotalea sp.]